MPFLDDALAMIEGLPVGSPATPYGLWRELETLIVNAISAGTGGVGEVVYATPLTGETLTAVEEQGGVIIVPAVPLAVLHLVLPPNAGNGAIFEYSSTQDISAFDIAGAAGDSVAGASGGPFVLAANGGGSFRYRLSNMTWYPR